MAETEAPPTLLTCVPASIEVINEGIPSAWSCQERSTSCEPRDYDLGNFERRESELVQIFSSREDGITVESVARILADGTFEETVQWRDGNGRTTFREVTRGRCDRNSADR